MKIKPWIVAIISSLLSITFNSYAEYPKLPTDRPNNKSNSSFYYKPTTNWYIKNYNLSKYSNYKELYNKYNGHLPSGHGLSILQAEGLQTPSNKGDISYLFNKHSSNTHSNTVYGILTELSTYPILYTKYSTLSPNLDSFHSSTTADLRDFLYNNFSSVSSYPEKDVDGNSVTPPKLLNISNTNGGSSIDLLNRFDKFVEENDMVSCTAASSGSYGNATTSGMSYNSIVVEQEYVNPNNYSGAQYNAHGFPRYKPDLIAHHLGASSYSTPFVCSAAAILLEKAKNEERLNNAYNSIVIKSILMAGATRFNYKASTNWTGHISEISQPLFYDGPWERVSDTQPISKKYGAGALNILSSYEILNSGEYPLNITQSSRGWDYESSLNKNMPIKYHFSLDKKSMFSSLLTFHRKIDDNMESSLPDYKVSVFDSNDNLMAISDNTTSNVELIEKALEPGDYYIEVILKDADYTDKLSYAIAWTSKEILPRAQEIKTEITPNGLKISWENDLDIDAKYRLITSSSHDFSTNRQDIYFNSNITKEFILDSQFDAYYIQLVRYPSDENVAFQYPSEPAITSTTQLKPIVMYSTPKTYPTFGLFDGAQTTREGTNNYCKNYLPDEYTGFNTLAFLSLNSSDTIKNFKNIYNFDSSRKVISSSGTVIKDSWDSLMDHGPDISLKEALQTSGNKFWSQTLADGSTSRLLSEPSKSCNQYTTTDSAASIGTGDLRKTSYSHPFDTSWIGGNSYPRCSTKQHVICVAY